MIMVMLFWCNVSYGLDMDTCSDYSAKANSDAGAAIIYSMCLEEKDTSFYNRSEKFKCALKAAKAKTDSGAKIKFSGCLGS